MLNTVSDDENMLLGDYFPSNEGSRAMSAGETGGGAQVKSAVRTVELLEYFAGRPGMHSLAARAGGSGISQVQPVHAAAHARGAGLGRDRRDGHSYGIGVRALLVGTSYIDARRGGGGGPPHPRPAVGRHHGDDPPGTPGRHERRLPRDPPVAALPAAVHPCRTPAARALDVARQGAAEHVHRRTGPQDAARDAAGADGAHHHRPGEAHTGLHQVREQGFAVDREENTLGLRCFGVAIPYRTPARDAISCSVPVARLTPAHEQMIKDALFDARDRLTLATRRL